MGKRRSPTSQGNLWWIEVVSDAVNEKRKTWKLLENGGSKEEYLKAKKKTKTAIYIAKRDLEQFTRINNNSDKC